MSIGGRSAHVFQVEPVEHNEENADKTTQANGQDGEQVDAEEPLAGARGVGGIPVALGSITLQDPSIISSSAFCVCRRFSAC